MLLDINGSLRLAEPFVPSGLISSAAWERLRAIASILPASIVVGTFESRLDGSEQVDYQICFTAKSGGRDKLAASFSDLNPDGVDPFWRGPLLFLRYWSTAGSLLFENSPAAWLEFDADLADSRPPIPFPFFTLPLPWEDTAISAAQRSAAAEAGLDMLAGGSLDAATRSAVLSSLNALPPSACLLHAALRPVGTGKVARLVIRIPVSHIPGYLERVGWKAEIAPFAETLKRLCTTTLVHSVQLDVTGCGIGPRIGIEFHYATSPRYDRRWQWLLDELMSVGVCTAERRAQVETWADGPAGFDPVLRSLLVKVVYQPQKALAAKAYLPFMVNPLLDSVSDARGIDSHPMLGPSCFAVGT
jgi:hypothetical protein